MDRKKQAGYITLEACITLVLFMFLIFFIIGLTSVFMARATMTHTLLQTAQSMSMDQYETDKLGFDEDEEDASLGAAIKILISQFGGEASQSPYFTDKGHWYDISKSDSLKDVAKKRFIGYLSNGNEEKAKEILDVLNVTSTVEGIDFTKSKIENGDLYLTVNYQIEYSFNAFLFNSIDMEQTVRVKMLK